MAIQLLNRGDPTPHVSIAHVGTTNITTTYTTTDGTFFVAWVSFRITNLGRRPIMQTGVSCFDARNGLGEPYVHYWAPEFAGVLSPGQSKLVSVVAPWDIEVQWRAGFTFYPLTWRYRVLTNPSWLASVIRQRIGTEYLSKADETELFTDWVQIPRTSAPKTP